MNTLSTELRDADLHQLQLPFAALRINAPAAIDTLARSIEQQGQLVPVMAVAQSDQHWILIDGYRRLAAVQRCGQDQLWVELWQGDVADALVLALAKTQDRRWDVLEEAALIQELIERFDWSQRTIGERIGRDVSWINRRLALLSSLPEAVLTALRGGHLSSWAASRVMVPLARANTDHATTLLAALQREPLSSRELNHWFEHYQQSTRAVREHLVSQPGLWLKAWRESQAHHHAQQLAQGPEGRWQAECAQLQSRCRRLSPQVRSLFEPAHPDQRLLYRAFVQARQAFDQLAEQVQQYYRHDQ